MLQCSSYIFLIISEVEKVVKIPMRIDAIAMAPNCMKIVDVMDLLKGSMQRQVHEFGRAILSEFKMLGSITTPEVFHMKPEPFGHHVSIVYTQTTDCSKFGKQNFLHFSIRSISQVFFICSSF